MCIRDRSRDQPTLCPWPKVCVTRSWDSWTPAYSPWDWLHCPGTRHAGALVPGASRARLGTECLK
eukprot:13184425-Alexandrium_andersonii.AAC.1